MSEAQVRKRLRIGALAALGYAVLLLGLTATSPDLGFVSFFGSDVLAVHGGSEAARAGLRRGDRILAIDGSALPTRWARENALNHLEPGAVVSFTVARPEGTQQLRYRLERRLPIGAAAGLLLAASLLALALIADRGGPRAEPRKFYRSAMVYVIVISGIFVFDRARVHPYVFIPWFLSAFLAAPVTCHFMLQFPVGADRLPRWQLALLYVPSLLAGLAFIVQVPLFEARIIHDAVEANGRAAILFCTASSAIYLAIGGMARIRRMFRKRQEIDPVAIRWLAVGALVLSLPLVVSAAWAFVDVPSFINLGLAPLFAVAVVGASFSVVLALTRTPFGELDQFLRTGAVYLISLIDARYARERRRARRILGEAARFAAATLDEELLGKGVVARVREALRSEAVALYEEAEDQERRLRHLDGQAQPGPGALATPIEVNGRPRLVLLVAPPPSRSLDEEDRDLLETLCAGLSVAFANAHAHGRLNLLSRRLAAQVQLAERRRREIGRLKERIEEEKQVIEAELKRRGGHTPVIGAGLADTFELVQKVARSQVSVLVSGETGVGKELIARAIHAGSSRRNGPFVVVDCGATPPTLFQTALFGHERGAFTGAVRAALGAFRAAQGGTLFLDEIGELPPELQRQLLRVLEAREVQPIGGQEVVAVDARIVAGTNRDLPAEVASGRFREDLLYRLNVVAITIPPLRKRPEDIPALAESFLAAIAAESGTIPRRLAPESLDVLASHDWPGNVRELQHVLQAAVVTCAGEEIRPHELRIHNDLFRRRAGRAVAQSGTDRSGQGLRETLEDLERDRLFEALREHRGNRTAAARALGLSRGALLRRLARYGEAVQILEPSRS